ncbi:neuroguidin isoform X4 [Balearica regulorum gibbericeps]|uniref:neuroguidin isoform X4 n=1 Tax=Balearica regulorum gibbericeps TaxID=100784 RepID=UPI003F5E6FDD
MAEAVALLEALRGQVAAVTDHGLALLRRVGGGRLRTEKGVSLLEVLEKLRPAERRLKYQLEKLLRAGGRGDDDPLRFRPAPANMEEEGEDEEEAGGAKAPGLGGGRRYVPPRLVPVQYDAVGQERERRAREAARRRALSCSVIRELREELGDAPHQVGGDEGGASAVPRHAQMRRRYEETMMVRLRESRRERAQRRRGAAGDGLDVITHFGDITPLLDPANQEAPPPKKKKKQPPLTGRRKRRGFRRRR